MYISENQLSQLLITIESCASNDAPAIVLSVISVIVAIGIPSYIAYRQNKIALYEKRLDAYQGFLILKEFYSFLTDSECDLGQASAWRGKYINSHYTILNSGFERNGVLFKNTYAKASLERDNFVLQSLIYLGLLANEKDVENAANALKKLIESLFGLTDAQSNDLLQKKQDFEDTFSELLISEDMIKNSLKITKALKLQELNRR